MTDPLRVRLTAKVAEWRADAKLQRPAAGELLREMADELAAALAVPEGSPDPLRVRLARIIEGMLHDHAKYPQLRLPEMQLDRVKQFAAELAAPETGHTFAPIEKLLDDWQYLCDGLLADTNSGVNARGFELRERIEQLRAALEAARAAAPPRRRS